MAGLPEIDISTLGSDDLHRVRHFIEHHLDNIITPLDCRLQMEQPGTIRVDPTLQAAVSTVKRVKALVAEVKALDDSRWVGVAIRQGRVAA